MDIVTEAEVAAEADKNWAKIQLAMPGFKAEDGPAAYRMGFHSGWAHALAAFADEPTRIAYAREHLRDVRVLLAEHPSVYGPKYDEFVTSTALHFRVAEEEIR